jgi:hypothetical protein
MAVRNRFFVRLLLLAAAAASSSLATTNVTAAPGGDNDGFVTFGFPSFSPSFNGANVTVLGEANINLGALQITPDSGNVASKFLVNRTGRVLYSTPFKLWAHEKKKSGNVNVTGGKRVASFSTVFTLNVFRPNGTEPAEGVAFVILPAAEDPPPGSFGGYLGLTNAATDGDPDNRIVAVELDTEKQAYDPDDNHVGLDVHSVVSVATASLKPLGIEISPVGSPVKYNVWVDYDGAARRIAVYIAVEGKAKPRRAALAAALDLGEVAAESSYFGFSASTGRKYQLNCVLAWNMTVEKLPYDDEKSKTLTIRTLAPGLAVGVVVLVVAGVLAYVLVVKRRGKVRGGGGDGSVITGTMIRSLAGGPREFEYRELRKATGNFDEKMKLGQGGYGVVYRGVVVGDDGCAAEVAVKKFSRASTQGQNDFLAELSIINRLRHKHLVRLVGKLPACLRPPLFLVL